MCMRMPQEFISVDEQYFKEVVHEISRPKGCRFNPLTPDFWLKWRKSALLALSRTIYRVFHLVGSILINPPRLGCVGEVVLTVFF